MDVATKAQFPSSHRKMETIFQFKRVTFQKNIASFSRLLFPNQSFSALGLALSQKSSTPAQFFEEITLEINILSATPFCAYLKKTVIFENIFLQAIFPYFFKN